MFGRAVANLSSFAEIVRSGAAGKDAQSYYDLAKLITDSINTLLQEQ